MRIPALTAAALAAATLVGGCTGDGYGVDPRYRSYRGYDYNRSDPAYGGYYADRYYVDDPRYRERRLSRRDRVYRGENGNYSWRRPAGTTGLIVGGVAGGVLGNLIAPGGSGLLGTLLGGAAGALAGREVDRNNVRCR